MKKKVLYLSIITIILLAPIIYWLNNWWGVSFSGFFSFDRIKYIYSQDDFLLIVTVLNFILYGLAVYKIFTAKSNVKNKNNNEENAPAEENKIPYMLGNSNSDVNWESLYGENKVENNSNNQDEENKAPPIPKAPIQTSSNEENVSINTNTSVPNEVKENNVVSMGNQVMANDVYRRQIADHLEDYGYTFMGNHIIDKYEIDFIEIAESDTLVVGIINSEYGDIIANETSTSEDIPPSWFTNEKKYISPVWEVKNASNAILKMINEVLPEDNGIIIKPVVVIPAANVSNQIDIEAKWEELGVSVVRFLNHSKLPDLVDVLPDKRGTELLESYKNFVSTLMKYFDQKAKNNPMKKTG